MSTDEEDAVTPTNNLTLGESSTFDPLNNDRRELESRIHAMEVKFDFILSLVNYLVLKSRILY